MLKVWRFTTLMFVALSMGLALCHLLEMPVRLDYAPALWSQVTNIEGTYRLFGSVGSVLEVGAWLTAVVLTVLVRKRRRTFPLTLLGALLLVAAQGIWWLFVFPANNAMADWRPDALPPDFVEIRNQWEYTHAVRALLQIVGFGALVLSVLVDTRSGESSRPAPLPAATPSSPG